MMRLIYIATQVRHIYLHVPVASVHQVSLGRSRTQRPMCLLANRSGACSPGSRDSDDQNRISHSEDLTWVWNCNRRGQDISLLLLFVDRGEKNVCLSMYESCTCMSKFGGKGVCNCKQIQEQGSNAFRRGLEKKRLPREESVSDERLESAFLWLWKGIM